MAMKKTQKGGFALLVAVIFMSVMLALGLALASLGYKQQVLASAAVESQYAFYAADAGLECGLYYDQQQNYFAYNGDVNAPPPSPLMSCTGGAAIALPVSPPTPNERIISTRLSYGSRCVDVTVYKPHGAGTTLIFSQGYDVPCATIGSAARIVSRGISVTYTSN